MIASVLIIAVSMVLFVYWFRYTVILILNTAAAPEYAQRVASANHLSFVDVRAQLHAPETGNLGSLYHALQGDYKALKYLLRHAANLQPGGFSTEQRMLMINFRLMTLWFQVISRFRPASAKLVLLEMSGTLEFFANAMGQRFASLTGEASRA